MSATLLIALASLANPGLSARLVPVRAVEGQAVPVVVEVLDAAGVVGGVRVEVRTASASWVAAEAERDDTPGRTFEYKAPGEHGDFDLISLGSDGKPGGENWARDIGNWE